MMDFGMAFITGKTIGMCRCHINMPEKSLSTLLKVAAKSGDVKKSRECGAAYAEMTSVA